ncbi:phage shock protein A [Fischerella thermalis CCMEE 5205]|uniref:Phage shock protein A n=1 Tax=Fischerella thermalis CCMEE 5318 TaxID=2019666 RepID=A0A2N6LJH8_9CYAN|nr:PspA/IM30 family protein [Fischerella thermalis]PMB24690.1 phage shock protein A [Fischerella thermalis CCMEE 5318]PMB39291.1 phage shock protein A [Fischerella thermalis CCMEE 5205]
MGLIDRIGQVIRANINSLVRSAEDPEKVLEKTVLEMQDNLVQLRQAIAAAIASQKRTERQAAQAQSAALEWYRRAQLALQQGNETLAREALTKRRAYQETATALLHQIEEQSSVVARLKKDMRSLELKITELKTKKDMYIARARSAEASVKLQELLEGVSGTSSLNAFERMEEKVLQLEAQKEAIAVTGTDELEKRFADLESEVDADLLEMKAQLPSSQGNTQSSPQQLPQSEN